MKLRAHLAALLALSLGSACGGKSSQSQDTTPTETTTSAQTEVPASNDALTAMPEIPSSPAAVPATLVAEVALANPNSQITQLATFADAVSPGMGAFMTPQGVMQAIEGMVGSPGLVGIDLNGPMFIVVADGERLAVVATVSSEGDLQGSLSGGVEAIIHDGMAVIGRPEVLREVAPYALSNLAKQELPTLPTLSVYVGQFLAGAEGAKLRQQMASSADSPTEAAVGTTLFDTIAKLTVVRTSLEANPTAAILHMVAESTDGALTSYFSEQQPSQFSQLQRLGSGPWAVTVGGRLDLSFLTPLLTQIPDVQQNPMAKAVAEQVTSFQGEMGFVLNTPPKPEFALSMSVDQAETLQAALDGIVSELAKSKTGDMNIEGMKGSLKQNAIKTRGGSLHEVRFTPETKELKDMYGNRASAFFGVATGQLLATFGPSSKKHARTLASAKGNLPGKGKQLDAAITAAKAAGESLVVTLDPISLRGDREPKDVEPVVLGVGFSGQTITGRLVFPVSFVKEAEAMN